MFDLSACLGSARDSSLPADVRWGSFRLLRIHFSPTDVCGEASAIPESLFYTVEPPGGGGTPNMKGVGMLVVSLKGVKL